MERMSKIDEKFNSINTKLNNSNVYNMKSFDSRVRSQNDISVDESRIVKNKSFLSFNN